MKQYINKDTVSEELEEEITNYINKHYHIKYDKTLEHGNTPLTTYDFEVIAKYFANWQKEQMMKDAVDAIVGEGNPGAPQFGGSIPIIENGDMILLPKSFKYGDKIKIVIIKED